MERSEFKTELEKAFENDCSQFTNLDVPNCNNIYNDMDLPQYELSKRFEKKMTRLIKRQKKPYFALISTAGRRVVFIIVAAFVILVSSLGVLKQFAELFMTL